VFLAQGSETAVFKTLTIIHRYGFLCAYNHKVVVAHIGVVAGYSLRKQSKSKLLHRAVHKTCSNVVHLLFVSYICTQQGG